MMIAPELYIEHVKDYSYEELIKERDNLYSKLGIFEKGKIELSDEFICPSPDVEYQMHLKYLSALCIFMQEKYNKEYVWGDKILKLDK